MSTPSPKPFYRIEQRNTRKGPYRHAARDGNNVVSKIMREVGDDFDSTSDCRPSPVYDSLRGKTLRNLTEESSHHPFDFVFGFQNLKQVWEWWTKDPKVYEIFKQGNFVLRRYVVNERLDARAQSCALKKDCKRSKMAEISFKELLTLAAKAPN